MAVASIQIGAQAIKNTYEQALQSNSVDFICLGDQYEEVLGEWWDQEYSPKLYDGKRNTREILSGKSERKGVTHQYRISQSKIDSDVIVTPDWVALVTYGKEPGVVMIEDKELVKTMKMMFESVWSSFAEATEG